MQRDKDFSTSLYESVCLSQQIRQLETTARVIASEVAIGEKAYYGSVKPINDYSATKMNNYLNDSTGKNNSECSLISKTSTLTVRRDEDKSHAMPPEPSSLSPQPLTTSKNIDQTLSLQLLINSLSGGLSYTSVDTTVPVNTQFNENNDVYRGSSIRYVSPMGSTTKLITSDTSSIFKFQFCGMKCLPVFGTFFMAISLSASLGNILRLPTTVFQYGGGTFLLAYFLTITFIGIPLTFLEIILGQFCQQGTTKLWRAVPIFKGVGVVKLLSCVILCLYYPTIIVSVIFHLIWSLYKPLPTTQCISKLLPRFVNSDKPVEFNDDETLHKFCSKNETHSYGMDNGITLFGIELALLAFVWVLIMLCVCKNGISFRLSSIILVPCAIFIVITLFIEGIRRNTSGINRLLNIKWESFFSIEIWYTALIQFFFSSHVGLGNITTCAGGLYPKSNPFWTAIFYVFINASVGVAFVCIFFMWYEELISANDMKNTTEVHELFILTVIYDVVSKCYGRFARIWAFMSYVLIALAGFISVISLVYTIIVGITVEMKNKWRWLYVSLAVCMCCFIGGFFCILSQNFYVTHLFDHYVLGKLIITTTGLEVFAFVWFYGLKSLSNDFEFILGYKLNVIWKTVWFFIPIIFSLMVICSWYLSANNAHSVTFEGLDSIWFNIIDWLIYLLAWITIITIGTWKVFSQVDYNFSQKFISATKPTRNWGPVDPIYRYCWIQWRKQYQATGEKDFTLRRRGTRDYTHSVKRGRHAGPIGMQYSVKPTSNQNTLEHKKDTDNFHLRYSYAHSNNDDHRTWASND